MEDTQRQLLQQIITNPKEDSIRLVYADWLEEHGDEARAEFIRLEVALGDGKYPVGWKEGPEQDRRRLLFSRHTRCWLEPLLKSMGVDTTPAGEDKDTGGIARQGYGTHSATLPGFSYFEYWWTRGFVSRVSIGGEEWIKHWDKFVWNPTMTNTCEVCRIESAIRGKPTRGFGGCLDCNGTGFVPRPMPDTVLPIEHVTITDDWGGRFYFELGRLLADARPKKLHYTPSVDFALKSLWPGIKFDLKERVNPLEMPVTPTWEDPFPDVPWGGGI